MRTKKKNNQHKSFESMAFDWLDGYDTSGWQSGARECGFMVNQSMSKFDRKRN